jgi:archaellum component FlaC
MDKNSKKTGVDVEKDIEKVHQGLFDVRCDMSNVLSSLNGIYDNIDSEARGELGLIRLVLRAMQREYDQAYHSVGNLADDLARAKRDLANLDDAKEEVDNELANLQHKFDKLLITHGQVLAEAEENGSNSTPIMTLDEISNMIDLQKRSCLSWRIPIVEGVRDRTGICMFDAGNLVEQTNNDFADRRNSVTLKNIPGSQGCDRYKVLCDFEAAIVNKIRDEGGQS